MIINKHIKYNMYITKFETTAALFRKLPSLTLVKSGVYECNSSNKIYLDKFYQLKTMLEYSLRRFLELEKFGESAKPYGKSFKAFLNE